LIDIHNAKVTEGQEADDALGIAQTKYWETLYDTVICSIDKDLKTIPGYHYNWTIPDAKVIFVDEDEANRRFYTQLLSGDTVDNIKGLPNVAETTREEFGIKKSSGCGPAAAAKILEGATSCKEMYERCLDAYREYWYEQGDGTDVSRSVGKEDLIKNARLVYIRKHEGEMWCPSEQIEI
jgi:5'-3' exonuclease